MIIIIFTDLSYCRVIIVTDIEPLDGQLKYWQVELTVTLYSAVN